MNENSPHSARYWAALAAMAVVALLIRVIGIGDGTLSHPENFASGLDMPDWVSFPPERHDLRGVWDGTLIDGHPPLYFVLLLGWVKAFGTTLAALRMPSALVGAASVALVWLYARREIGRGPALLAAALLALHGHHIYWSQMARMYTLAAGLVLACAWAVSRCRSRPDATSQLLVFAAATSAMWTQLYAWPAVFGMLLWLAPAVGAREKGGRAAFRSLIVAVAASAPVIQLSLFQNPSTSWRAPVSGYAEGGYLFAERMFFWEAIPWSPPGVVVAALFVPLVVLGATLLSPGSREPERLDEDGIEVSPNRAIRIGAWSIGMASSAFMALFAWAYVPPGRDAWVVLWALVALPPVLLLAPPIMEGLLTRMRQTRFLQAAMDVGGRVRLSVFVGVVAPALMIAVSVVRGVWVERGTIVFVPFLLILTAQGISWLWQRPAIGRATGACWAIALITVSVLSVPYAWAAQSAPRDYKTMAEMLESRLGPSDLILVRDNYGYPPLLFHLSRSLDERLVYQAYSETVAAQADPSVWVVWMCRNPIRDAAVAAVSNLSPVDTVAVPGVLAMKFVRPEEGIAPVGTSAVPDFCPPSHEPSLR